MTRSMLIEVQKKNTQRKALYSSEREGAIIGGTETKFKAEEERGGYQSPYESQQSPAAWSGFTVRSTKKRPSSCAAAPLCGDA